MPVSHISVDFETNYSRKQGITVKRMIAEQYASHPDVEAYMLSIYDGSTAWAGHPRDFNWETLVDQTLVSHNKYFDYTVWRVNHARGLFPSLDRIKNWYCTADLSSYLCNRRSLADAVEKLFKEKVSKAEREDANNKRWPHDFSEKEQAAMLEYAKKDAIWCWKIFAEHGEKWPEWERRLSNMTIAQGTEGLQIDTQLLDRYMLDTFQAIQQTANIIPWVRDAESPEWDDFSDKPTSTKNIAEQCRRSGIPCPPVKSHDADAFEEWELTYAPAHSWIPALSSWRSLNKLYVTFKTMRERLRPDGTMPFGLKYFGAHTGRWAGDSRVNVQNQRKLPVVINEKGLMELDDSRVIAGLKENQSWVTSVIDFRRLIIPRPGKKMIVSDLSQIEPRVLAWLTKDQTLMDLLAGGMSIYEAHARQTMGWTGGNLSQQNPQTYALAKARVLGLGYQCAWEKFILMAKNLSGLDITKDDPEFVEVEDASGFVSKVSGYGQMAKKIVAEFREQNPKIVGFWNKLDGMFKASIGKDFEIKLPSGRVLRYERVRSERRIEPAVEPPHKPITRHVVTADVDGVRRQFYGGKLTENVVQAVARDVFAWQLLKLEDAAYRVLFSVHDEAVLEVEQSVAAPDIEQVMSLCPPWLAGCPIAAKAKEVPYYVK